VLIVTRLHLNIAVIGTLFWIKARDKKRRFDLADIIFKLKKGIKIFVYMSKIRRRNLKSDKNITHALSVTKVK